MFKFTIAIAALAVSVSLAAVAPEQQRFRGPQQPQQVQQMQQMQQQQQQRGDPMAAGATSFLSSKQKPDKVHVYVTEVEEHAGHGIGELIGSALYKLVKIPKKVAGAAAALIVGKLKSLGAKGLIKAALLSGLVAVLATVAAVVTVSVAGLVAAVTGVCATVLHFKHYLGGGGGGSSGEGGRAAEESQMDYVAEFVLGAFDKYGEQQ